MNKIKNLFGFLKFSYRKWKWIRMYKGYLKIPYYQKPEESEYIEGKIKEIKSLKYEQKN